MESGNCPAISRIYGGSILQEIISLGWCSSSGSATGAALPAHNVRNTGGHLEALMRSLFNDDSDFYWHGR